MSYVILILQLTWCCLRHQWRH